MHRVFQVGKLHLNKFFCALCRCRLAALLLFLERDLAEMKPTDVIAPLLASINRVCFRHTFVLFCLLTSMKWYSAWTYFFITTDREIFVPICFPNVKDVSTLHFWAILFAAISHGSIRLASNITPRDDKRLAVKCDVNISETEFYTMKCDSISRITLLGPQWRENL